MFFLQFFDLRKMNLFWNKFCRLTFLVWHFFIIKIFDIPICFQFFLIWLLNWIFVYKIINCFEIYSQTQLLYLKHSILSHLCQNKIQTNTQTLQYSWNLWSTKSKNTHVLGFDSPATHMCKKHPHLSNSRGFRGAFPLVLSH